MTTSEQQSRLLRDGATEIDDIMAEAVALAVEEHRRLGYPIAVWRDDRVVWIAPEDIPPLNSSVPATPHPVESPE